MEAPSVDYIDLRQYEMNMKSVTIILFSYDIMRSAERNKL